MRALVTGATGFVGRHLVEALHREGIEIWASYHRMPREFPFRIRWIHADLCDSYQTIQLVRTSKPAYVFHLGAQSVSGESWKDPDETLRVNVGGSLSLFEGICRFVPRSRVVVVSSGLVYGRIFPEKPHVSEKDPTDPISPYAGSKLLMEMAALHFYCRFGLQVMVARAFNQIGQGQTASFVFPEFCRQISEIERGNAPLVLHVGNLQVRRDFIHVRDAAQAYLTLARRGKPGQVYNVSSGRGLHLGRAVDFLKRQSRVPFKVRVNPKRYRLEDLPLATGSSAKLRSLGWRPRESVWQGLKEVLAEWRSRAE